MPHLSDWNVSIQQTGRVDWPQGVTRYSPWLKPRTVNGQEVWFLWRGRGSIRYGKKEYEINQGQIIYFRPNVVYDVVQDPEHPFGINYVLYHLHGSDADSITNCEPPLPDVIRNVDANLAEAITRHVVELHWESYIDSTRLKDKKEVAAMPYFTNEDELTRNNPFAPLPITFHTPKDHHLQSSLRSAHALFRSLLAEIYHQNNRQAGESISGLEKFQRQLVASVAIQIQENLRSVQSVAEMALENGYSTDHFTRTFKKIMGCSPQQFLVNSRINKAKHMLIDSDLSVKEVADQLGYCNAYFFSRQFKSIIGCTPSQFRASPNNAA